MKTDIEKHEVKLSQKLSIDFFPRTNTIMWNRCPWLDDDLSKTGTSI